MPGCEKPLGREELAVCFDDDGSSNSPQPEKWVLSISNVAELFGISQWQLRYYEFRGLIKRRQRIATIPVFSWADCDRIAFIIKCRKAGLTLAEVAPIIQAADDDSARVHESGQELCMALVEKLEAQRKAVDEALSELSHTHSLLSAKLAGDDQTP